MPALLVFLALTAVLAYPVIAVTMAGGVPGWEGDNVYYVRSLWWMKHAIVDLGILPFVDPGAYFPVGHAIARSEMSVANTIPAVPITMMAGPVMAYDVVVLFSFVATALGTYLWVTHLTGRRWAGLLAGTIVGFLPYRFAHLPGHLPQLTMQWIPLTLYAFERFLEYRTVRRALWVGVFAALVVLGCWYYGYSLALLLPVYVVLRTWRSPVWRERQWWLGLALSGATAIVLVLPFLLQMLALRGGGAIDRPIAEMQSWALNYYDPLLPNLIHPFWWDAAGRWFPAQRALWVEKTHALGLVAMAVALVGLVRLFRSQPAVAVPLAGVWLASYAIALGPLLMSGDRQVRIPVPDAVAHAVGRMLPQTEQTRAARDSLVSEGLPVPLPSYFLHKFVPFTSGMRVMARFTIWTAMMTAALAGFGLLTIMASADRRFGRRAATVVPILLVGLVAFESCSRIPTSMVGPRAVDLWLAGQPDDVVIVEMPVEQGVRPMQNYWTTQNHRKNVFGWNGDSFPPPVAFERMQILGSFPAPPTVDFLRSVRTTYVLLTPSQIPNWETLERLVNTAPGLQYVQTFNDVRVYRVLR